MATRWLMLLILFLARLAMGYQFQSVASVSANLVEEFGFSYTEVGTLIGFYLLPGVFFAIPIGMATRFVTDKNLLMLGAALMLAGALIMAFASDSSVLYGGRLVTGVGGTIFNVILTKMVTDWFFEKEIVTALAIMLTAWPIGIALGLLTHGLIASSYGWVGVMHATAAAVLVGLLLAAIAYKDAPTGDSGPKRQFRLALPRRQFIHTAIVGCAWTLFNVSVIVIVSFSPDVLIEHGYTPLEARSATSLSVWVTLFMGPLGGRLTELTGRVNLWIVGTMLVSCIAAAAISRGLAPELSFIVLGCFMSIPVGAIMALMSEAVTPENRGPGLGIFYTWYYVGMAIGPAIAGWTRDVSGSVAAPVLLTVAMLGGVAMFVGLLRLMQATFPIEAR